MERIKNNKFFLIALLAIFCLVIFFAFLGSYPLIDVDETRYVRIAQEMFEKHNFLTPIINGELFLEKPPLFFWMESFSFAIFGVINEWSARIPMALVASLGIFATFFIGKKFVSERFGFISALILGSNVIYIVLSHIAILDLLLSVTMMISAYCGILTLFAKDKMNWVFWSGFYIFCGLSVLSKGIPGLVIPFMLVFFAYLFTKRLKDLFDFKKIGLGLLLLLLIVLPWHIMMYNAHGEAFINEYIVKHHIARFVNSVGINRKEPVYFYIPVILIGFIPFVFSILAVSVSEIKKWVKTLKNGFTYNVFKYFSPEVEQKKWFLNINILSCLLIFLFFSASSTKLPTYILPMAFPMAFITAYIFDENFEAGKFDFQIKISNIILSSIFGLTSLASIIAIIFFKQDFIVELRPILISGFLLFGAYSVYNFIRLKNDNRCYLYSTVIFMTVLTLMLNLQIFNYVVSYGEGDLIKYAKYAKEAEKPLATFGFGQRYSTICYYGDIVEINSKVDDFDWLDDKLDDGYLVILKNKNMMDLPAYIKAEFKTIYSGKKYSLVEETEDFMFEE